MLQPVQGALSNPNYSPFSFVWLPSKMSQGGLAGLRSFPPAMSWSCLQLELKNWIKTMNQANYVKHLFSGWQGGFVMWVLDSQFPFIFIKIWNQRIIESFRLKRKLRYLSSDISPVLSIPPLNHIPKCFIFRYLQVSWLHHIPGQPMSMLDSLSS